MKIDIALEIGILLIGFYLAFFKSYFSEKGKNLATNEDIEKITGKIEAVRQKFIEKNALLQAELNLLTNLQIGHINNTKDALFNLHQSISLWYSTLTSTPLPLLDDTDDNEIKELSFKYENLYSEVQMNLAHFRIFCDNNSLLKHVQKYIQETVANITLIPKQHLLELRRNNLERERAELHRTDSDELFEKRMKIYTDYREKLFPAIKENIKYEAKYYEEIQKYLRTISE